MYTFFFQEKYILQQLVFLKSLSRHFFHFNIWWKDTMDFEGFITRQSSRILKELLQEGLSSKKPRRGFSKYVKKQILLLQGNRCNYCYIILDLVNYDHIDGNRSNNLFFNCQALCPNCHAKKTRRKV